MTKRRIHLTESQLYGLINRAINEEYSGTLEWRTLADAADKANCDRLLQTIRTINDPSDKDARRQLKRRERQFNTFKKAVEDHWGKRLGGKNMRYYPALGNDCGDMVNRNDCIWYTRRGRFRTRGNAPFPQNDDELVDYFSKKSKRDGRGQDESIAHRVTESVMRKLREDADMDGDQFEDLLRYAYKRILEILFIAEEFSKRKANKICQVTINNMTRAKALLEALGAYKNVSLEGSGSPTFKADSDNLLFYLAEKAFSSALSYIEDAIELAPMEDGENEDNSTTHQILYKIRDILEYVAQKW